MNWTSHRSISMAPRLRIPRTYVSMRGWNLHISPPRHDAEAVPEIDDIDYEPVAAALFMTACVASATGPARADNYLPHYLPTAGWSGRR